jgi:competence protein ComEA
MEVPVSDDGIRDRLRTLGRAELIGLVILGLAVVGGAGFWYVRSLPSTVRVESVGARPPGRPVQAAASPSPSPTGTVIVHVAGWVHHPGVYELRLGQRVIDALKMAGGARPGADLTSINLAALLTDAEQIVIGKKGAVLASGSSGTSTGGGSAGTGSGGGLVDINTATLDQLEALPHIGPALGQRIIDYREEHGPFASVDDLNNVSGIGDKTMEDLRPLVTV